MSWHFQVVRSVLADDEEHFAIHEAYPDSREKEDELLPITENAVPVRGESVEALRWMLNAMLRDIDRHGVVEASDYPKRAEE